MKTSFKTCVVLCGKARLHWRFFVAFQRGNLICIVTILFANIGVWLLWRRK